MVSVIDEQEPRKWVRRYLGAIFREAFTQWDRSETVIGLVVYLVSLGAASGAVFGFWEQEVALGSVTLVVVFAIGPWFLFLMLFVAPAKLWRDAQPPPFNPFIGDPRIEPLDPEWTSERTGMYVTPGQFVLRLDFWNLGPPGKYRAFLVRVDGKRRSSGRIPLAWALEEGPVIFLPTDIEGSREDPVQATLGYLMPPSTQRRRGPGKGDWEEVEKPFSFRPAMPRNRVGDEMYPTDEGELHLLVRIGTERTNQWMSAEVVVTADAEGNLLCS